MLKGLSKYTIREDIYEQGSTKISVAIDTQTNIKYVLKQIQIANKELEEIIAEGKLQSDLHHSNIVEVKECFVEFRSARQKYYVICMEYSEEGNLDELIGPCKDAEKKHMMTQIAEGLRYLHDEKQIIHMDLKPENILSFQGILKISDLGLARLIQPSSNQSQPHANGTAFYMAPELHQNIKYSTAIDIWALGIIFLEIILENRIWNLLEGEDAPYNRKNFPAESLLSKIHHLSWRKMIQNMLNRTSEARYTINQVLAILQSKKKKKDLSKIIKDNQIVISISLFEEFPKIRSKKKENLSNFPKKANLKIQIKQVNIVFVYQKEELSIEFQTLNSKILSKVFLNEQNLPEDVFAHYSGSIWSIFQSFFQKDQTNIHMEITSTGVLNCRWRMNNSLEEKASSKKKQKKNEVLIVQEERNPSTVKKIENSEANKKIAIAEKSATMEKKQNAKQLISQNVQGDSYYNNSVSVKELEDKLTALTEAADSHLNLPAIADMYQKVATAYMQISYLHNAIAYFQQASKLYISLDSEFNQKVCHIYLELGRLYKDINENAKALQYLQMSLEIRTILNIQNVPMLINNLNLLGITYHSLNKNVEAVSYYDQIIDKLKDQEGFIRTYYATALHNKANVLMKQLKLPEAITLYEEAIQIYESYEAGGKSSLTSYISLSDAYASQKNYANCFTYLQKAMDLIQYEGVYHSSYEQTMKSATKTIEKLLISQNSQKKDLELGQHFTQKYLPTEAKLLKTINERLISGRFQLQQ